MAWCRDTWSANASYFAVVLGIAAASLLLTVAVQAVELHRRYPLTNWGTVPEAFAAVGTVLAVVVALWQSTVIRRQAEREATDGFAEELTSAREIHAAEMKAADVRHKAELEAQREIARVQRVSLLEQEFKLALIRVSKAASAYTHELATLIAETSRFLKQPTQQGRDDALKPISKQLGARAHDLTAEISGAHMLTNNDDLHAALDRVTAAAIKGPASELTYKNTVVSGKTPNPAPLFMVMEELPRVIGDARRLAGRMLVTGWN